LKTASQPLITKPSVPLKDLAMGVMMGARDEDTVSSLAGRLARLEKQLDENEQARIRTAAGGISLNTIISDLVRAIDPDTVDRKASELAGLPADSDPGEDSRNQARDQLVGQAANVFTGPLIELIDTIRRDKEQTIVHDDLDKLTRAEWAGDTAENAKALTQEFADYLNENRDEIEALIIYFSQPARRSQVTYNMIKTLLDRLRQDRPKLAPLRVWQAYAHLDNIQHSGAGGNPASDNSSRHSSEGTSSRQVVSRDQNPVSDHASRHSGEGRNPVSELTALVSLIRRVCGIDATLTPYAATVRKNFQTWIMQHHSGAGEKFNEEQMAWLHMIRDHIISSFHIERDDLEMSPFNSKGGMGKMYQLFGDRMDEVIEELNRELVA
ncbi:MAG: type I restriction-modification enzyme R subunit C-terminal domain-containing protein, partial [Pseudomonadales bacterium]